MQNYKKICELLENEACKPFVSKLLNQKPSQIVLQYSGKIPCDVAALAYIIQLYQKAADKLPLWQQNYCALSQRSFEQSTSQLAALYKSTFIKGKKLLVLGGGLGVDEWAFAKTFTRVISIDIDAELNEIVAFNYPRLEIINAERVTSKAEDYLENTRETFDCIYTDPDRRDEKGVRKITLGQSTPDILALLPKIWSLTDTLIIKASPLLEIKTAVAELGNVSGVRVIAIKNEVKEILITAKKGFTDPATIIAANHHPVLGWQEFSAVNQDTPRIANNNERYFYEPNTAIIKAGLHQACAAHHGLGQIDPKTAYYTGTEIITGFEGRSFIIISSFEFSKKNVGTYLKQHGLYKANVAKRNFRLSVDEIKKLFKIKDGGEDYLFFTQRGNLGLVFHCKRL